MKRILAILVLAVATVAAAAPRPEQPWAHGDLRVSDNGTYLEHSDGTPFFWLGQTGWSMPARLDRNEVAYFLSGCHDAGYNVVQVQVINGVPAYNIYGQMSHPFGWDFSQVDRPGVYGYWDHMDYIVDQAALYGMYVAMVPIWGGLVKAGLMSVEDAKAYGTFLGNRYKDRPNIIWLVGGDVRGDIKTEQWCALAEAIKAADGRHLMSFHPFGRTSSATWFHDAPWLDFNMFQSGHRRYDQIKGDGDDTAEAAMNEDNWRYVEAGLAKTPRKPILDGEPSYEEIPQGLHDPSQPYWKAPDVRRYAYWAVFAGACGHTYGHNAVMQMLKPAYRPAYSATKTWYEGMEDPGFGQMQHLKNLMLAFPYKERVPDQKVIAGLEGHRYDRLIATCGEDYLLVYNYTNCRMDIDLDRISGQKKKLWWYSPVDGSLEYIGEWPTCTVCISDIKGETGPGCDRVLIAVDSSKDYVKKLESRN